MKKVFFSSIVALAFMFSACNKNQPLQEDEVTGVKAQAVATQTVYLKGSGSSFNGAGWTNVFNATDDELGQYPNVWHLEFTGTFGNVTGMQLTFTNGEAFTWTPEMGASVNGGGKNPGWVIYAPYDWEIAYVNKGNNNESESFLIVTNEKNVNFNISGFTAGKADDAECELMFYMPVTWDFLVSDKIGADRMPNWDKIVKAYADNGVDITVNGILNPGGFIVLPGEIIPEENITAYNTHVGSNAETGEWCGVTLLPNPAPAPACGGQITATFPGVKNVAIQYYSAAKSWETAPGMFDDEATIVLPEGLTVTSLRAVKDNNLNGMYYQVNGLSLDCKVDYNFEVPVIQLRIFGMNADCNIGVIQNNWVYPSTPVPGGKQQLYWVFDNGKNYTAQLSKAGFYSITSNAAERTVYEGNEELWISFGGPFYEVTVPAGITNVRMQSNNWIVNPANEGDKITLLADYGNIRNAKMSFVFEGKTYNVDFKLDGTNPFTGLTVINVPGLTDVTLQYYHFLGAWGSNGEWVTVGTFDETSGFINIPAGTTAIRVVKAGMSYQVDVDANAFNVINVPVLPITVMVNQDCKLAVVQSDWVYNWTPATTGANVFNVFANGKTYDVRMQIGSNPVTSKTGVNAGGTVTF